MNVGLQLLDLGQRIEIEPPTAGRPAGLEILARLQIAPLVEPQAAGLQHGRRLGVADRMHGRIDDRFRILVNVSGIEIILTPKPRRIIPPQFGFQGFELHITFVLLVPDDDRRVVDVLFHPAAELRFGLHEVFAGRLVVVHETPFVLNHQPHLVGNVVPLVVSVPEVDAQVVEAVILDRRTQETAYPRFVEHHARPAVQRPLKGDILGTEQGFAAVDQHVPPLDADVAKPESLRPAIRRTVVREDEIELIELRVAFAARCPGFEHRSRNPEGKFSHTVRRD